MILWRGDAGRTRETLKEMRFQPDVDHLQVFQTSEDQMFSKQRQMPAWIWCLQPGVLSPGTTGFICAGCRELYLGAQQGDVWADSITSWLLVCKVHSLCGAFITISFLLEEEEGNSRREKKVEGRRRGSRQGRRLCGACLPILSDLFFFWEALKLPSQN